MRDIDEVGKKCHPSNFMVGIKVDIAECQPEI